MKVIVIFYLVMGLATCGKITAGGLVPDASIGFVVAGNLILLALLAIGVIEAAKRGKFLGFSKGLWLACTLGSFAVGAVMNVVVPSR